MPRFFTLSLLAVLLSTSILSACAQQSTPVVPANTLFYEVENFQLEGDGWRPAQNAQTRRASLAKALSGATGSGASTATQSIKIPDSGTWRIWVRYMMHSAYRGPFEVDVLSGDKVVATQAFDVDYKPGVEDWDYRWDSFEAELPAGEYSLRLRKHENKNSSGYTRNVDAILLTRDFEQKPDHIPFGPQTWMKVTLGDGYEKSVQIHIFADHYRSPWYGHYAVSKDGVENGLNPKRKAALLAANETTGWVNISRMIYQDSGARLVIYPAYTYGANAKRFKGTIEFANRPNDDAVVRKLEVDSEPSTLNVVVPPNLETPANIAKLRADSDFAAEYGRLADNHDWPKAGKMPVLFPFFVAANLDADAIGAGVLEREMKTLSHFGFNGLGSTPGLEKYGFRHKYIGGVGWHTKGSYSAPDLEKLRAAAPNAYSARIAAGVKPEEIAYAMVMDEPQGEPASKLAADAASIEGFRAWLQGKKLEPKDLLVASWDEVKPVVESERDKFPALHYYTQQYRTVALGNFIALQKQLLHEQWKTDFPVNVNFSDGAIYYGNFYGQGVDYFTLLHETDQNAIWSEDWSNLASTYQNATFNVELMRAAARKHGQHLGQFLIAYAGRKGYDIRLKAVSEAARGVKAFKSFAYGPMWATHEGSPWQAAVPIWRDHAAVIREIGAVEDLLLPAQPRPAEVALLYSSAADAWTVQTNLASGFDRMHTWLAFSHAQLPIDVVHESEVGDGLLDKYKVAYLSDPNITREAAEKLRDWVRAGGTLVLAAGAGQRDEFNRPLSTLDSLLPYQRAPLQTLQAHRSAGRSIPTLAPKDTVSAGKTTMDVLALKQTFSDVPANGVTIEATFQDGSPASLRSAAGNGWVVARGYLPALDYIRKALVAKNGIEEREQKLNENQGIPGPEDVLPLELNEKSYNPWQYPGNVREAILQPARAAKLNPPVRCSVPLVDAVYMTAPQGVVIPLANYTLQPIQSMTLDITVDRPVREVRSVYQGVLPFQKTGDKTIRVTLPLDCTDFLTIR